MRLWAGVNLKFKFEMDIERLNKIKQICLKGNKPKGKQSKSPFDQLDIQEKENQNIIQISKHKNDSKADPLKKLEKEVTQHYQRKQQRLEQNIRRFNETVKSRQRNKGQTNMTQAIYSRSQSPARSQRSHKKRGASPLMRRGSPVKLLSQDGGVIQLQPYQYLNKGRSLSPISRDFFYENQILSNSFCETSQFGYGVPQLREPQNIKRIRDLLNNLLVQLSSQRDLITNPKQIDDMKLRLNGAFDQLTRLGYDQNRDQLQSVIQSFLNDLGNKIQVYSSKNLTSQQFQGLKRFLEIIQLSNAQMDLEVLLPEILEKIQMFKIEKGLVLLSKTVEKLTMRPISTAFKLLRQRMYVYQKQKLFIRLISDKYHSRANYTSQIKGFNQWKYQHQLLNSQFDAYLTKRFTTYFKDSLANVQSVAIFTFITTNFIKDCLGVTVPLSKGTFVDLFYHKDDSLFSYKDGQDGKFLVDQPSLLENIRQSMSKYEYVNNCLQKKQFNQEIDIPLNQSSSLFIKDSKSLQQIMFPVTRVSKVFGNEKKLTMIVRVTLKNQEPIEKMLLPQIIRTLLKLSNPIVESYRVFNKLHKTFSLIQHPQKFKSNVTHNDKLLNQLSYLQQKSLELSQAQTISDCFKLLHGLVNELFTYEKLQLLQYTNGQIQKIYDNSKGTANNLGYTDDTQSFEVIRSIIHNQIEGYITSEDSFTHLIKQTLSEHDDTFEMEGKVIKDKVVISLDLQKQQSIDVSSLIQLTQTQSVSSNVQNSRYFLRLEKKLQKPRDQIDFIERFGSQGVLMKQFTQLVLFTIAKIKSLAMYSSSAHTKPLINELDLSKLSQMNEELKRKVKLSNQIDGFIERVKTSKASNCFTQFEHMLGEFIRQLIPNAEYTKLFLTKAQDPNILYTYISNNHGSQTLEGNHQVSASSVQTSIFQSTTPMALNQNQPKPMIKPRNIKRTIDLRSRVIRVRNLQLRAHSQANNRAMQSQDHQQQFGYHLEDISSISGGDAQTNIMDKNSIHLNTFIIDNHMPQEQQHRRQPSMTRQPSLNLFSSQSSHNLQPQLHQLQRQKLKRDKSAKSELNTIPASKITEHSEPHSYRVDDQNQDNSQIGIKDKMITSQIILENQQDHNDESMIMSQRLDSKLFKFSVNNHKSLLSQCFESQQVLMKRNIKNDKRFNQHLDKLIVPCKTETIENMLLAPILTTHQKVCGIIQVANCDKAKPFTEQDATVLQILAEKLSRFLHDTLEKQSLESLFKKQLEVSILNSTLENQSITTILRLANKLFQSRLSPVKAVCSFLKESESYLQNAFSCKHTQILVADYQTQQLWSATDQKPKSLQSRANFCDGSIATALIKNHVQEPVVWPISNDYILIGDNDSVERSDSLGQTPNIYSHLFNSNVDIPQNTNERIPSTYLALTVRDSNMRVLAIIQLMSRPNGFKFTTQDVKHLQLISDHLTQIFEFIESDNYLKQHSLVQLSALSKMTGILNKQYRSHLKQFFRQLLQFKYGQANLLKNKIMRKYIDRHMKVDQLLVDKIHKLGQIKQKLDNKTKSRALGQLKEKITQLNEKRQNNAAQCLKVFSKYDRLLSLRVKDTAFRFWEHMKRIAFDQRDLSQLNNSVEFNLSQEVNLWNNHKKGAFLGQYHPTFNVNQNEFQLYDNSQLNQSSLLDESSITSIIYMKAKAIYKLRKIFNQKKLRVAFDTYLIKAFANVRRPELYIQGMEQLRLIKLHNMVKARVFDVERRFFNVFKQNMKNKHRQEQVLKKVLTKKQQKYLTFGVKHWHNKTENSIRQDLKNEKSFNSQLTEQCRENTILQLLTQGFNSVFARETPFKSVEECLYSNEIKQVFMNLCDYLGSASMASYSFVITFALPKNYHLTGNYYACFVYPASDSNEYLNKTVVNQNLSYISSINDISRNEKAQVYENFAPQAFNHFSSISDVINFNTNANNDPPMPSYLTQPQMFIHDFTNDFIVKSVTQARSTIICSRLQDELQTLPSLKLRMMSDKNQAMITPLFEKNSQSLNLFGTLEVYQKVQFESTQFFNEDQGRFKQYTTVIHQGLQSLVRSLSLIQNVYNLQLQNDILQLNTLSKGTLNSKSLSQVVSHLSEKTMQTFKADHCLLIFVPSSGQHRMKGTFYNFANNKLYQIDFKGTFFEQILQGQGSDIRQVTFPSSLVCRTLQVQTEVNEKFETLTGKEYEALKYIPIVKGHGISQLIIFAEVGWSTLKQAQSMHDNDHYLLKMETLVKDNVLEQVGKVEQTIKLFMMMLTPKVAKLGSTLTLSKVFQTWKEQSSRLGFTQTTAGKSHHGMSRVSPMKDNAINQRSMTEKRRITFADDYSPQATGGSQMSPLLSGLYFHQSQMTLQDPSGQKYKRHHSSQRHHSRKISHISGQLSTGHPLITEEPEISELEVEKAAKRKLVSASLFLISLVQKSLRTQNLRQAMSEWQNFTLQSQIAERAFNEILEINHKHSTVRYQSAIQRISKLDKVYGMRQAFMRLQLVINQKNPNQRSQSTHYHRSSQQQHFDLRQALDVPQRGSDTQEFEDEQFTLQELDSSIMYELKRDQVVPKFNMQNERRTSHQSDKVHTRKQSNQHRRNESSNMMIIDQQDNLASFNGDATFDSEFSLGTGTQHLIKFKAESILEQARNDFKQKRDLIEERIARIKGHKGVKGLLIVDENGKFLRSTMSTSGNDTAPKQYAQKVTELAKKARSVVRDLDPMNDLTFFRVRSKRQEIMVAPDKNLFLIVIQQPADDE